MIADAPGDNADTFVASRSCWRRRYDASRKADGVVIAIDAGGIAQERRRDADRAFKKMFTASNLIRSLLGRVETVARPSSSLGRLLAFELPDIRSLLVRGIAVKLRSVRTHLRR